MGVLIYLLTDAGHIMSQDAIIIEPYNLEWPRLAREEIQHLKMLLDFDWVVDIVHIGSTAVPDLSAKPIIDLMIGLNDFNQAKLIVPILEKEDYVFWQDNPKTDRLFFVKGMPPFGEKRTHHVHVCSIENTEWINRPLFRDYLINKPDVKAQYAELKIFLAQKFPEDREAYTEAKTEFIKRITAEAHKGINA